MDEATTQATFCATLVDEWVRAGVSDAVVAPGSRSTPITVALARHPDIRVHVQVDERSAGFLALGLGLASGRPAVVVTTSGTAAVELHPAVVEADLSSVPLLVVTSDRPPELHGVGAPQTVDQRQLYGRSVREYVEPGVARADAAWSWRSLASRAARHAATGPVHLNLAFTEPLLAEPGPLPEGRADGAPWTQEVGRAEVGFEVEELAGKRCVVVAGRGSDAMAVVANAERCGWPVLADPLGGHRDGATAIRSFDLLARSEAWAGANRPEAVVWCGGRPASKALAAWLREVPLQVVVDLTRAFVDPDRRATHWHEGILSSAGDPAPDGWLEAWRTADATVQAVLDDALATEVSEPSVARAVTASARGALVVASSMPIRDVEWFGAGSRARVLANRGANGIDGAVSTAVGVALTGVPTVAHVGDLAFLHDTNALLGAAGRDVSLTVVVVDNDGGGIFSFLPQAGELGDEEFECLFGTPHGLDLVEVARGYGVDTAEVTSLDELRAAVADDATGIRVRVVKTDRQRNVELHQQLYDRVARTLTP